MKHLPIISPGALLTMPDGYRVVLADAAISGRQLWWHEAFGREHFVSFDSFAEVNGWLQFLRGNELVAVVGEREGGDDDWRWTEWLSFLKTDEGACWARSIEEMKASVLSNGWS